MAELVLTCRAVLCALAEGSLAQLCLAGVLVGPGGLHAGSFVGHFWWDGLWGVWAMACFSDYSRVCSFTADGRPCGGEIFVPGVRRIPAL
eukprot:8693376-Alexandrium_andersonii.AAC.1